MRLFSLDTSFSFFNFSVVEDGRVKLLQYLDSNRKTLENLPKLLSEHRIDLDSFDAFAVSVGVGYLTSVRIGVTFMKTTAYLLKKPLVPYENLYLLGRYTPCKGVKIPFLKVSTNVFYRVFGKDVSEVKIYRGEKLSGQGITLEDFKEERLADDVSTFPFFPFSAYGGVYATEFLKDKPEGEDLFKIEPLYLKPPA